MTAESRGIVQIDEAHTAEFFFEGGSINHRSDVPTQIPEGRATVTRLGEIIGAVSIDDAYDVMFEFNPESPGVKNAVERLRSRLSNKIPSKTPKIDQPISLRSNSVVTKLLFAGK